MPDDLAANPGAVDTGVKRRRNALLWWGFILSFVALGSYVPIFAKYPVTRDVPWANYLLFALALALLFVGLRRAFTQPNLYRGKIAGPILGFLSLAAFAFFCVSIFYFSKHLPASTQSPKIGQKAPEFALADTNGATVSLASLLSPPTATSQPAKGVLLVFYRGYW